MVNLQPIYKFNKKDTIKDLNTIINELKNELSEGDKIVASNPTDVLTAYYLIKNNIDSNYLFSFFFPERKLFVILNKNTNQKLNDILKEKLGSDDIEKFGIKKLKMVKDYQTATLYEAENISFKQISVIDYNKFNSAEFNYARTSDDKKQFFLEEGRNDVIKYIKIPIQIKENTDYLISFEIKCNKELNNTIYVDFIGEGYDNPEQEFTIEPNEVHLIYTEIRRIINSGKVPNKTQIYFRAHTSAVGEIDIQNLKIFEVEKQ